MFEGTVTIYDVLKLTVLSMTVVFLSLLSISLILELFKVLFYDRDNKKKQNETIKEIKNETVDLNREDVLAAIFTAAVAASNGKRTSNLRIKSIKKIS